REEHARLKIPDLVRQTLPCAPKRLHILHEAVGHRVLRRLEEGIDERSQGRALRHHDDHAGQQHHEDHRQQPPALVAREKGNELAGNADTPGCGLNKLHFGSLALKNHDSIELTRSASTGECLSRGDSSNYPRISPESTAVAPKAIKNNTPNKRSMQPSAMSP